MPERESRERTDRAVPLRNQQVGRLSRDFARLVEVVHSINQEKHLAGRMVVAVRRLSMLEFYFVRPQTVDRIRALWLGPAIEQYVA